MTSFDDSNEFKATCIDEIKRQGSNKELIELAQSWISKAEKFKYSYHFEWLGRPIIQHPQDILGLQQLLWSVKPNVIIETGIARGGSIIFNASILELISLCGGPKDAKVIGIDVDIREHNKCAIINHPMSKRIHMIEGSSVDPAIVLDVKGLVKKEDKVLVCLDSNHTHDHVLKELKLYTPFVSEGSYCVVLDTILENMPEDAYPNRPWGRGNNPKTAVHHFLKDDFLQNGESRFEIDKVIENQLMITAAPDGFLRRKKISNNNRGRS